MSENIAVIKLAAIHGNLKIVKNYIPASETVNGVRVEIDFRTDEWDILKKTVGFYHGQNSYGKILESGEFSCNIPWEILLDDGCFYVNIVGVSEHCVLTTNRVRLRINLGGYKELIDSSVPTPTLYEQLLKKIEELDPSNYVTLNNGFMQQQLMEFDPVEDMQIATRHFVLESIKTALDGMSVFDAGKIIES